MIPSAAAPALLPLAAALVALLVTAATGFDQKTPLAPEIDARFYGFFLDRYPLFAFALVYGLARVFVAAASPGPASLARRALGCAVGVALLIAVGLHPTFGGVALRAGFATGGMAFMSGQPMALAYLVGAASVAFVFGLTLGIGVLLTGGRARGLGWGRGAMAILARFLAVWFAFAVIGLAHAAGFGTWPRRPMLPGEAAVAAALILAGFLPHALLALRAGARDVWRVEPASDRATAG